LTLREVSFRYPGTDADALKDVTLHVPRGAVVALIGENGAGKTTLVKLISGLYQPTRGTISLDSTDLATVDQRAWRRMIGAGFQDFCRFEFLTRESIGVGDVTLINDKAAVTLSLEVAGGLRLPEALPSGLETQLGTTWPRGVDLSGGQWQTIALARASMHPRPLLVILDEPTSALDAHAEHQLFERISAATRRGDNNGRITLLVSHRFSTARMADLIVVLEKGEITEIGSHEQLMQNAGLYSELFKTQAAAYK
jgi:ATP-binding cassette subfamily B protein